MSGAAFAFAAMAAGAALFAAEGPLAWTRWGGPSGDFRAPAAELGESWPEGGPPEVWSRPLGDGYSAILFEDGRLYTMYRSGEHEIVVCLDAATGATLWEHRYEQPPHPKHLPQHGDGPRATPLIAGERLFTVGVAGRLLALDKETGEPLWSRELWGEEIGGRHQGSGYSSSPAAYDGLVIAAVGATDGGVIAFDQGDGRVVWKSPGFQNSYSSPTVIEVAGRVQVVVFMADEMIGLDPESGRLLWRYPHGNSWNHNIHMPVVVGDVVFLSSPQAGARGIRLVLEGDGYRVDEIWVNRRVQLYHVSSVRDGDWIYGSTGSSSPAFLIAINARTGEIAWRERGVAKANLIAADGRLVILDEDGVLYLASASPEELVILERARLLDRMAWTAPTIVGTTLYARDKRRIVAVDLGAAPADATSR